MAADRDAVKHATGVRERRRVSVRKSRGVGRGTRSWCAPSAGALGCVYRPLPYAGLSADTST
jgi:hypothetical protein